jgi:hypothetical protein
MELRCEGDSRGTLFRVRFGFTRTPASPAAAAPLLLLLPAAAALFLRGLAIASEEWNELERERLEAEEEEGREVGGQLWWPLEVAVLKTRSEREGGQGLGMAG